MNDQSAQCIFSAWMQAEIVKRSHYAAVFVIFNH